MSSILFFVSDIFIPARAASSTAQNEYQHVIKTSGYPSNPNAIRAVSAIQNDNIAHIAARTTLFEYLNRHPPRVDTGAPRRTLSRRTRTGIREKTIPPERAMTYSPPPNKKADVTPPYSSTSIAYCGTALEMNPSTPFNVTAHHHLKSKSGSLNPLYGILPSP